MRTLLLPLPGNDELTAQLAQRLGAEIGAVSTRRFPDGETYVRFECDVQSRSIGIVCTLDRPDDKTLRLLFAADAARDLGAADVGLIAPYLGYMRQDRRFMPGEAITSKAFAGLLSSAFDWIVTVDPHLHRRASMSEIYTVPVAVCHAAPSISAWIRVHVADPVVIGPDVESEQWVASVASEAGAPYTTLEKTRLGDRDIRIHVRDIEQWRERQPVLVDDIISSGRTMEVAIRQLVTRGFSPPAVVGVHGLFAEDAFERLQAAGAGPIVSTNAVTHATNAIDLSHIIEAAVRSLREGERPLPPPLRST